MSNYKEKFFGLMPNMDIIHSCELTNKNGMSIQVINYGATLSSLRMPLKNGEIVDVVLGFDTLKGYTKSFDLEGAPYFGATIGRFAGRIDNGSFILDSKKVQLNKNHGRHSLHGGIHGFSQKVWKIIEVKVTDNPSITLQLLSLENDENFPGNLSVELKYTLSEDNELVIEYQATATADTAINLTNHSYFNLEGHGSTVVEQDLMINSTKMLETTNDNIPTGTILDVANGFFDFSNTKKCPAKIDNTFVVATADECVVSLFSKKNNLRMTVYTNQPGVHIYVGGSCSNQVKGKENTDYHSLSGICFETQNFPDAPNHTNFPSAILKKGQVYQHKTIYKFQLF